MIWSESRCRIRDLRQRGWSIARIAKETGISERQARNILRG